MTTQQDERAELIAALKERAAWDKSMGREEGPALMMQAAAILEADAKGGKAVAWVTEEDVACFGKGIQGEIAALLKRKGKWKIPLYTRPQQAAQVPLTEDQICKAGRERLAYELDDFLAGARYAEAAHGIGKAERTCGACGKAGCVAGECGDTPVGIGKDQG